MSTDSPSAPVYAGLPMKIWVDVDACPIVIKEILYRAAERRSILLAKICQ